MLRPRALLALLLALALARYAAACLFIHPFADDFSYAAIGMRTGLAERLCDEYRTWNGRWLSNVPVLRSPLLLGLPFGLWLYRAVPLLLLALTWLCARRLLRAAAPLLARSDASMGAGFFLLLFLQLMPDPGEGVFWYTGAVSYLLPGALLLWLLALHGEAWAEEWRVPWPRALGMGLLAAAIAGCNELHMALVAVMHAGLVALRLARRRPVPAGLLLASALALGSALAMILAPGNAVRGAHFPLRHEALRTLAGGALQTARFAVTWMLSPALVLASMLFLAGLGGWLRAAPGLAARLPRPAPLAAALLALLFACMALPYWATGILGQHRTANAALLALLPGWFALLASLRAWALERSRWSPLGAGHRRWAMGLLLLAAMATGSGGRLSGDLLSGRLARFDRQLRARYAAIHAARMRDEALVAVPALADPPHALRYLDATDDPEHWINRSVMAWAGAEPMRLRVVAP